MKKILLLALSLSLLAGCATYDSRLGVPGVGPISLPKDSDIDRMRLTVEYQPCAVGQSAVPKSITLELDKAKFKMNPAVIDSKTAHDVQVFNAGKDAALQIIGLIPK